jgi:hypothetical protein
MEMGILEGNIQLFVIKLHKNASLYIDNTIDINNLTILIHLK